MSKNLVKKFNAKTPNDKTLIQRANNAVPNIVAHKTPKALVHNMPIQKLRNKVMRRSKSCDLFAKVSLDTTISGNYNSKKNKINKNDKLSGGIQSIFAWTIIGKPDSNSSTFLK